MQKRISWWAAILIICLAVPCAVSSACASDPYEQRCGELLRKAQTLRQDLKTVDIVLGSAIDAGTLDRIRSYKLTRSALRKQLESVLKALRVNECTMNR